MTAFATSDDLAARLGLTLTEDEAERAETLLEIASGLIRDAAGQEISLVEDDELTIPGTSDDRIRLPQRPVIEISSVTLDGRPLTAGGDWYLDGNVLARRGALWTLGTGADSPFLLGSGFGGPGQALVIVYTHGYDDEEVPETVKATCLEMVVRVWVNPGSVVQENIAGVETTYAPYSDPPRGLMLTDSERSALRRLFGRRADSITVGG